MTDKEFNSFMYTLYGMDSNYEGPGRQIWTNTNKEFAEYYFNNPPE